MDEICPACTTVHQGFTPREGQHHSFWQCRKCATPLYTIKVGNTWEVHGEVPSMHPDLKRLREYHEMLRTCLLFVYHPILSSITGITEDADSMASFYDKLKQLH